MGARARFRARATSLLSEYQRLERAAQDAARRNNANLWYVADSFGGIFSDSLATADIGVGGGIGQMFDRSYGTESLGHDVLNGGGAFASSTGWSFVQPGSGSAEVSNGSANINSIDGTYAAVYPSNYSTIVEIGRRYNLRYTVTSVSGAGLRVDIGGAVGPQITSPGEYSHNAVTVSGNPVSIVRWAVGGGSVDFIEVREILNSDAQLGPETIGDTSFDNPASWVTSAVAPSTISISGGVLSLASPDGSSSSAIRHQSNGVSPTIGLLYRFELDVVSLSGPVGIHFGGVSATQIKSTGRVVLFMICDGQFPGLKRLGSACSIVVNSISVREVLGVSCAQPTTANKPQVVRTARKFNEDRLGLTWVTPTGYVNATTSLSSAAFDSVGSPGLPTRVAQLLLPTLPGVRYRLKFKIELLSAGTANVYIRSGSDIGAGAIIHTNSQGLASGSYYDAEFLATASQLNVLFVCATAGVNLSVREASLQQVAEYGYAMMFDGSNDELICSSKVITNANEYTVIAACDVPTTTTSSEYTLFAQRGATGVPISGKFMLAIDTSTTVRVALADRNDANELDSLGSSSQIVKNGQVLVASGWITQGKKRISVNGGAPDVKNIPVFSATNTTTSRIGGNASFSLGAFLGKMYLLCVSPTAMVDADRIAIEKFAVYLSGSKNYAG